MCVSLPNDAVLDNMDEWLAVSGSVDKTIRVRWLGVMYFIINIKVWNVQTGKAVRTLTGHTATVTGVQLNTSAQWVASCSEDCSVRLWDVGMLSILHMRVKMLPSKWRMQAPNWPAESFCKVRQYCCR